MKTLPDNISLAIGLNAGREAVEQVLRGDSSGLAENLGILGSYFRIKIWFTEPVELRVNYYISERYEEAGRHWKTKKCYKTVTEHVFNKLFYNGGLYYGLKTNTRWGYPAQFLDKIAKWEIILDGNNSVTFPDYEAFKKKFDQHFITEDKIKELWNSKSGQHGHQYRRDDFRQIGKRGRQVMKDFLRFFKGVNDGGGDGYHKNEFGIYLTKYYHAWHHAGRDISISHLKGNDLVWYSSEYQGCGNGRYGLVATKSTYLWLEDD